MSKFGPDRQSTSERRLCGGVTVGRQAFRWFWMVLAVVWLLSSCSATKTVPAGEYLYTGSEVVLHPPDTVKTKKLKPDLEALFAPSPNRKLLGIPWRLYAYNLFQPEKEKGLFNWLQENLGEPPVLYNPEITSTVERLMERRTFNQGYFDASIRSELDTSRRKKVEVQYHVRLEAPYRFGNYSIEIEHPRVAKALEGLPPSEVLIEGSQYSLEDLQAERNRITSWLRDRGYYYFDADYLKFRGDSSSVDRRVNLQLVLKDDAPGIDLQPMYIDSVVVYPDFGFEQLSKPEQETINGISFVYDELDVRPKALLESILLRPGNRYAPGEHQKTQARLLSLPFYQFVNVRFQRSARVDSLLEVQILLTPRLPNTVEGSVGLSHKSTGFIGPELNFSFSNRNIFGGSELLRLSGKANFNFPLNDNPSDYFQEIEGGLELRFPGLLFPFLSREVRNSVSAAYTSAQIWYRQERIRIPIKPDTLSSASFIALLEDLEQFELADRIRVDSNFMPLVGVNDLELRFGYQWRIQRRIQHEFNPVRVRYQKGSFQNASDEVLIFISSLLTGEIENTLNLERMIVYQPDYIYIFDSRQRVIKRNNYFFRGRLSFAGNKVLPSEDELISLGQLESQYLQLESDFRYYLISRKRNTLATRLIINTSIPFGDEFILPYLDFYSVGGPNSLRAFRTREVGPGSRVPNPDQDVFNLLRGKGDIKLEGNIEYRHRLGRYFELATFLDAGNVWLFRKRGVNADERFDFDEFYREIALGTGLGLRVDISGLILRLDFGIPLRKPWLPLGERWVVDEIDFGDPRWRRENLVWNLAFGYPF